MHAGEMRRFGNARAREGAFYFVDTREPYGAPDLERFWSGTELVEHLLDGLGVKLTGTETVLEVGCGVGRITRGLAAWLGSHVELAAVESAAADARMALEKVWGEGGQYCQLLLRKRSAG